MSSKLVEEAKAEVNAKKQTIKNEKKEIKKMKNQSLKESIKTWTITVLISLILIASASGFTYFKGVQDGRANYEAIKSEAKELSLKQ